MPDSSSDADVTLDSSSSSAVVQETASTTVIPESTAPASVLDAVEAALKNDGVEAGSPPAETGQTKPTAEPNGSEPKAEGKDVEVSEEEMKTYTPGAQARIRELAARKNELSATVETLQTQFDTIKPKADSFDQLTSYLKEGGVNANEANNALEITRLIKSQDYDRAFALVAPIYNELVKRTGGVLDEDLREDVRLGHVPLTRAQEIQKARATQATQQEREQSQAQREEANRKQTEEANWKSHVTTVAKAADDWANSKADSDPDWNQKAELVAAQVNVIITAEGFPKTKADAIAISERALKKVEDSLRPFQPKPRAIDPNRHIGAAPPSPKPVPKSALEALEIGLAQS